MAAKLRPEDRTLLDILCLVAPMAAEFDRAFRLKPGCGASIDALRNRGLVAFDSLRPSESALAAFAERHRVIKIGDGGVPEAGEDVLRVPSSAPPTGAGSSAAGEGERIGASAPLAVSDQGFRPRAAKAPDWSEQEDDRLREAYAAGEVIEEVAEELGRTVRGTRSRAVKIGLGGTHAAGRGGWAKSPDWTPEQEARLREAYGKISAAAIAKELGRTKSAVYMRANELGLHSGYSRAWSADELRAIVLARDNAISLQDLARALGRNYDGVAKYAGKNGYYFGRRQHRRPTPTLAQILAPDDDAGPAALDATCPHHAFRSDKGKSKRPKLVKPPRGWADPDRQQRLVAALRRNGEMKASLAAIGMSPGSAYSVAVARRRFPDFGRACIDARLAWATDKLSADSIAAFARRAVHGSPAGQKKLGRIVAAFARAALAPAREKQRKTTGDAVSSAVSAARGKADVPAAKAFPRRRAQAESFVRSAPEPAPIAHRRPGPLEANRYGGFGGDHFRADYSIERRQKTDAEISAEALRHIEERKRIAAMESGGLLSIDDARLRLQRRGLSVCRANVVGGREDRWAVAGMGNDVTDEQLIARAQRVSA